MSSRTNSQSAIGKPVKIEKLTEILGDAVIKIVSSAEVTITHAAPIHEAMDSCAITFSSRTDKKAVDLIRTTKAGVILCSEETPINDLVDNHKSFIVVTNPRLSFLRLVQALFAEPKPVGVHSTAEIDPDAEIHPDSYIGPFAYVGKCVVGKGTVIWGHSHIYSKTRIGCNVVIHAGTIIGADGFGYHRNDKGELEKFPHIGGVLIENDVEIGANVCIDRGTLGDTIIRCGAKIDNFVHIAHNVIVGQHTAVIAHAMIGGSTQIGDYAWIAPSACLRDGISVGENATVGLGALAVKDVPDKATVMGVPARASEEYKLILKTLNRLVENNDQLSD